MNVAVFPLVNVCLFPGTTKPLNIFEPRYLQMMRDSVASGQPVALGFIENIENVKPHKSGEALSYVREIAGFGRPTIVQERLNGTLLVFMHAEGKVKLGPLIQTETPYLIVSAQEIKETSELRGTSPQYVKILNQILARWIQTHIPDLEQRKFFLDSLSGPLEIVGAFASYLVRDYDLQQMILEMNDINDKIQVLYRLVESNEIIT
jgi:Lon protease-like protein